MNLLGASYASVVRGADFKDDRAPSYVLTLKSIEPFSKDINITTDEKISSAVASVQEKSSLNLSIPSYCAKASCVSSNSHSISSFTVGSYNIGGRLDLNNSHYDRAVAVCLGKVMEKRRNNGLQREREVNAKDLDTIQEIQKLCLQILFGSFEEVFKAKQLWKKRNYSLDLRWYLRNGRADRNQEAVRYLNSLIGPYRGGRQEFVVKDAQVCEILNQKGDAIPSLFSKSMDSISEDVYCKHQLQKILATSLRKDVICIQEASWIDHELFLGSEYDSIFSCSSSPETESTQFSKSGIVWNRNRFDFVQVIEGVAKRAIAVQLRDKRTSATVSVVSAHITGCNPFYQNELEPKRRREKSMSSIEGANVALVSLEDSKQSNDCRGLQASKSLFDSTRGNDELKDILEKLERVNSDVTVIGVDLNATSLHPRMGILKEFGYQIDHVNYLYPTSTNPNYCLDTRIDWIAVKRRGASFVSIENSLVSDVELNDITTNVSDHRPIAAQIFY